MPKTGNVVFILAQNQHFWTFLQICALDFSEIVPDVRH